jgi:hypothetical protein
MHPIRVVIQIMQWRATHPQIRDTLDCDIAVWCDFPYV